MARTRTVPSNLYAPGSYGPFNIDSFTKGDASRVEVELTVESWPATPPVLATIVVQTDSGARMEVNVPAVPKNRDGTDATVFRPSISFPADGVVIAGVPQPPVTRETTGATVSVTVHAAFRTAITVRAV